MRRVILFILLSILMGCTTIGSVQRRYLSINYRDGVNLTEAFVIAQNKLIEERKTKIYKLNGFRTYYDKNTVKYPGYWFVHSPAKYFSDKWLMFYLVIIDKSSGEIVWVWEHFPGKTGMMGFDHVFNP